MKHIAPLLSLLFLPVFSSGQGIVFQDGSWAEVKAMAKEKEKPIFLYTYTTWCTPCKLMEKNEFPDEPAGAFYNANFINCKLDIEKGDGIDFAKKYNVESIPLSFYFSAQGELLHKRAGQPVDVDDFIQIGKDALDPEKQLASLTKKYESGHRDPDFLHEYAMALSKAEEPASEVVDLYLNTQQKADWINAKNWELISKAVRDFESEAFQYVAGNQKAFREIAGKELHPYLYWTLRPCISALVKAPDPAKKNMLDDTIRLACPEKADAMLAKLNYRYYQQDPEKGHAYTVAYLDNYVFSDKRTLKRVSRTLNSVAWKYYENETDLKRLEAALGWVERSIEISKTYENTDTRAALLVKLKRYPEAIEAAQEALKLGKQSGTATETTEQLLLNLKRYPEVREAAQEALEQGKQSGTVTEHTEQLKKFERHFDNGHIKEAGFINENGQWVGEKTTYYKNGQKHAIIPYENGKRHGQSAVYSMGGHLMASEPWVHGNKTGEGVNYHSNGQVRVLQYFENGRLNGELTYYWPSGQVKSKQQFKNGKAQGEKIEYDEEASVDTEASEKLLEQGKQSGTAAEHSEQLKKFESHFDNGQIKETGFINENDQWVGERITYYKNGQKHAIIPYENGKVHGELTFYSMGGHLMGREPWVHGKKIGKGINYYPSGQVRVLQYFENGRLNGEVTHYWPSGQVKSKQPLKNGKAQGEKIEYDEEASVTTPSAKPVLKEP